MSETIFTTRSLRKEYYRVVAVDDIDLEIPEGEIFGLIGPNGAGKTTTLRMLATTLEPTSGQAFFRGMDIWTKPEEVRRNIGFMPDFFQLYATLKVHELLKYFGIAHGLRGENLNRRVEEVLGMIDLDDKRDALVRGLSRGMMQRLCLGRAILHRPPLLLLDEPASGLDPLARKNLFDVLVRVRENSTTIVISSHILGELSDVCTSVGIMYEGRFLEVGKTAEIMTRIMPTRRIVLHVVGGTDTAANLLATRGGVSDVKTLDDRIQFLFEGDNDQLAELNASLVRAEVGVALLEATKTSLHDLYFAIAERSDDAAAS